jgi:hypothetical protein
MAGKLTRIMYIELKSGHGDAGPARIGRVRFSRSLKTLYYKGQQFRSCNGRGIGGNFSDVATAQTYWISGSKKNGQDRHWAGSGPVEIDSDVAEEYWKTIRGLSSPE